MSTVTNTKDGFSSKIDESSIQPSTKPTKVYIRVLFYRIGEIDTLSQNYQARVKIEARWVVAIDQLLSKVSVDDQQRLNGGKCILLPNYSQSNWHPHLYVENALPDRKEDLKYTAMKSKNDNQIYICESRDIDGQFWEKLKLYDFPSDVQDLSVTILSKYYNNKVILHPDPFRLSGVNRRVFVDKQQWKLYKYIDIQQADIEEVLETGELDEEYNDDDDENINENTNNDEPPKPSALTIICHVARRGTYFYWNGFCLIVLITAVSFCVFGIPPFLPQNRLQTGCTLLLASITFRWTVNRSLPTVAYLTLLDVYAIICLFILVIECCWHAIIGSIIYFDTSDDKAAATSWYASLDRIIFISLLSIYIFISIGLLLWLYSFPFMTRKNMEKKDLEYQATILKRKKARKQNNNGNNSEQASYSRIPIASAE